MRIDLGVVSDHRLYLNTMGVLDLIPNRVQARLETVAELRAPLFDVAA